MLSLLRTSFVQSPTRALARRTALTSVPLLAARSRRHSSTKPAYDGHIPLNWFENAFLAAGSAAMSLADPYRADMIAALGETTAGPALPSLRERMLESAEGRSILKERPRINTRTVDLHALAALPEGTLGRAYISWLELTGVTPDTRDPVHYIDDPELAYVMQRYRESHDFYHCILSLPVDVLSELAVKAFEAANLGLPMASLGAAFGHLRLSPARRSRYFKEYVPWAMRCGGSAQSLITVYWEKRWEQDVGEMKRELGIWDPPPALWKKPLNEAAEAEQHRATAETQP